MTWNLYNQRVASIQLGNGAGLQPLNAQSGVAADNPTGGGIQFTNGGLPSANAFTVTLLDQEPSPVPVINANQNVSLRAVYGTGSTVGTINAVSGPAGPLTPSKTGLFTNTTTLGMTTFANLLIYQSVFNSPTSPGYRLQLSYTNPNNTPVTATSAAFSIMPLKLLVTASNFAGFLQKAYNIIIANSSRGEIRLLNIMAGGRGLATNQVEIQAFDYSTSGGLVHATAYDGPITLTAADAAGPVTLRVGAHTYTVTPPFNMSKGKVIISNVTPNVAFGTFTLTADTTTLPGDPGGVVDVPSQPGTFIRVNSGRQRGR